MNWDPITNILPIAFTELPSLTPKRPITSMLIHPSILKLQFQCLKTIESRLEHISRIYTVSIHKKIPIPFLMYIANAIHMPHENFKC